MHVVVALMLSPDAAEARETGIVGQTVVGCACHAAAPDATTTAAFGAAPLVVGPGDIVPLTFTVSTTNVSRVAGGLDVAADAGTLVAGADTRVQAGELTHVAPKVMAGGTVQFAFEWTAPVVDAIVTFDGAGNAVNFNGTSAGDGWNFASSIVIEVDQPCDDVDLDGIDTCEGDCDDGNAAVFPGATEICDGLDNDCDLGVDVDAVDATPFYADLDRDGYGAGPEVLACSAPFDHVAVAGDCDDTNATRNPGADEVCDALDLDQDCDGVADDAAAVDATDWYADGDGDGYGAGAPVRECEAPPQTSAFDGDCDDTNAAINPGAVESCTDPLDLNCDGAAGLVDNDGDGFAACQECDDSDAAENPAATEVCDGDDDDCDGTADEPDAAGAPTWYRDEDLDGHGVPGDTTAACTEPDGYAALSDDCDDTTAAVSPDVAEVWYDGTDQDCDGNDDDQDGDGVAVAGDCDDLAPDVFPGAVDAPYDGVDADCAGDDDFDADGDGVAAEVGGGEDCDDDDPAIHPGVADPDCDGIDVDCDPGPDFDPACDGTTTPTTGGTTPTDPVTEEGKDGCGCASTSPWSLAGLAPLLLLGLRRR